MRLNFACQAFFSRTDLGLILIIISAACGRGIFIFKVLLPAAAAQRSVGLIQGDPQGFKIQDMKDKLFFYPHNGGDGPPP